MTEIVSSPYRVQRNSRASGKKEAFSPTLLNLGFHTPAHQFCMVSDKNLGFG